MLDEIIRKTIREMVGSSSGPPVAFLTPKGDRGLFGPESIAWRVHADFISMMIGGISSLVLQALHPQAELPTLSLQLLMDLMKWRMRLLIK